LALWAIQIRDGQYVKRKGEKGLADGHGIPVVGVGIVIPGLPVAGVVAGIAAGAVGVAVGVGVGVIVVPRPPVAGIGGLSVVVVPRLPVAGVGVGVVVPRLPVAGVGIGASVGVGVSAGVGVFAGVGVGVFAGAAGVVVVGPSVVVVVGLPVVLVVVPSLPAGCALVVGAVLAPVAIVPVVFVTCPLSAILAVTREGLLDSPSASAALSRRQQEARLSRTSTLRGGDRDAACLESKFSSKIKEIVNKIIEKKRNIP
jgi:hypothetical protein